MKPEHRLMLRKVGKGMMFKEPVMQDRRHRMPEELAKIAKQKENDAMIMEKITKKMEGTSIKRKPLKFKL